jgi:GNAT superfamily N-acetyltransferase
MLNYDVHTAGEVHDAFIYSSFLHGMRDTIPHELMPNAVFFPHFHEALKTKMALANVVIAVSAADADTLLGWAIGTPDRLEYVYVKQLFRQQGVARRLISEVMAKYSKTEHMRPATPGVIEVSFVGPGASLIIAMLAKAGIACAVRVGVEAALLGLLPKAVL